MEWPAWALDLWTRVQPYADRAAVWRGYEQELETLAIYGIGVAIYATLVYAFYNNISTRKPFHILLADRPGWTGRFFRWVESFLVFPLTSFVYFAFLALSLFVLAKSQSTQQILLVAMAVIVGIRATVYVNEKISADLAKLVPLSLLGVLLVDPGYLSTQLAWGRVYEATSLAPLLARYFLLFIALEMVLGIVRWSVLKTRSKWRTSRGRPTGEDDPLVRLPIKEPTKLRAPKQR